MINRKVWIALVLICSCAAAETMPDSAIGYVNRIANATENTIAHNLEKFKPNFTPAERDIVGSISVIVDKNDWNVFGTRAFIDNNRKRQIVFTIGYIIASDYMDRAWVDLLTRTATGDLEKYMNYVSQRIQQSVSARSLGMPSQAIKEFCEWSGEERNVCVSTHNSKSYYNSYLIAKVASIALVLGHEIGHHVKGHLINSETRTTYDVEKEADRYGMQLALRSQQNPMFAAGPFLLFASFSNDIPTHPSPGSHPPPLCRLVEALDLGFEEASRDKDFNEYLKTGRRRENWENSASQIRSLRNQTTSCL